MNYFLPPCVLLADADRWDNLFRGLSSGFREPRYSSGTPFLTLLIVTGIVGVILLLMIYKPLGGRKRETGKPRALFLSLCKAHGLTWRECWLLWRLGRVQRLKDPARLFLEPERWDATNSSPALRSRRREYKRLQEQLFAESPS
jgi:hypothetical protein